MNEKKGHSEETVARYFRYGFIAVVVLFVVAIALIVVPKLDLFKTYVASVGNENVSEAEFQFFLQQQKSSMLQEAGYPDEEVFWGTMIGGETAIEVAKKNALEDVKEFKIQVIKAKEQNISLSSEEIKNLEANIESYVSQFTGSADDESSKMIFGVNLKDAKELFKQNTMIQMLYEKETEAMSVSDDDILKHYEENKDAIDNVTVRHILIAAGADATEEQRNEAKKKAEEVLEKVNNGEDFAELAKQYSEDPGSKDNGGEYTFRRNSGFVEEFESWPYEHKVGDTGIIETIHGFHVMKNEKISTYEEVKEDAKSSLLFEKYSQKIDEWKKDSQYEIKKKSAYNSIK